MVVADERRFHIVIDRARALRKVEAGGDEGGSRRRAGCERWQRRRRERRRCGGLHKGGQAKWH